MRKIPLVTGQIYHIFSKSIADFTIFRDDREYKRMKELFKYYKIQNPPLKFSTFSEIKNKEKFYQKHNLVENNLLLQIIAYCVMPTHFHLIVKQLKKDGISIFMKSVLDSYTRYFNIKTKRKGPLWESRFKNVIIETDEQLLHLTRYIHLNPITAHLVDKPQDWKFSSYKEFLGEDNEGICDFSDVLDITPPTYKEFVETQIDYQRELAKSKNLYLE